MLGDGKCMTVGFYGDLDLDLHCEQYVRVTLTNVAVVLGLAFDIMSFKRMQEKHEIILNGAGASMLWGRVRFKTFRAGNIIQATRVPHDDASPHPPAMVAAMMRPGAPSSMNVNDFHNSLGHANIKTLYEATKQMGIKLTGIPFGYCRQAFQGEVPTWGGGCYYFFETVVVYGVFTRSGTRSVGSGDIFTRRENTGGVSSSAWGGHSSHVFLWSGDYLGDIFPRREYSRRGSSDNYFGDIFPTPAAVPATTTSATSSRGGGTPAAVPATTTSAISSRGGGTPAAVPAATTSAAAAISSRGGGIPAAVPAAEVTGGTHVSGSGVIPPAVVGAAPTPPASDPSVAAGTATGERLATGQEQLVKSGGRREVLAEVSRMVGGISPAGPGASGPPDMVHDGGAGGRWQGQRVTPAVTRSRAKRDGLWPGMFALMATQEDIARSIAELSPPDVVEQELPSDLTCVMETPETYVQAHTGPHSDIWTEAEGKELRGLNATGTFKADGSE